jgi:2,3-bisphosphoglycerate-independent phosphoglycerate mutase
MKAKGDLRDVTPTALDLLGLEKPDVMTGDSLILNRSLGLEGRPLLLLILDGWGYREDSWGNLIHKARTPVMDGLMESVPMSIIEASGEIVGLPDGTVGNSESGHLHIGSGRRVDSDRLRVERAIEDGSFYENEAFLEIMRKSKEGSIPGNNEKVEGGRCCASYARYRLFLQLPRFDKVPLLIARTRAQRGIERGIHPLATREKRGAA